MSQRLDLQRLPSEENIDRAHRQAIDYQLKAEYN